MGQHSIGESGLKYEEVCMLIQAYAKKLLTEKMSYADLLRNIDRLTQLGADARKLWGDR